MWFALASALVVVTPDDPGYLQQQAAFDRIRMSEAWELSTGNGQRIGVVDTGLVRATDDLDDEGGWNFLAGSDGDAAYDETGGGGALAHGTHVAGTIASRGDNGVGIAGINWDASVVSARALTVDGTRGNNLTIMAAARWLAGLAVENRPGGGAAPRIAPVDVINLSLGVPGGCDAAMQQDVDDILAAGVVLVAASGNHGGIFGDVSDEVLAPAACEGVISVGAFDGDFNRTAYTNANGRVDLLAPGGVDGDPIISWALAEDTLIGQQGTSMASPHVAGVVSLMRAVNPTLTPADIRDILLALPTKNGAVVLAARLAVEAAAAGAPPGGNDDDDLAAGGGCSAGAGASPLAVVGLLLWRRRRVSARAGARRRRA
jgi:serine protease